MIKFYSDDVEYIINEKSAGIAEKFSHQHLTTAHLWFGLISFFKEVENDTNDLKKQRYSTAIEKYRAIMNRYSIDGNAVKDLFIKTISPMEGEFEVVPGDDFMAFHRNMMTNARTEGRSMEVEDFIVELYSSSSYDIHSLLREVLEGSSSEEDLRADVISAFKSEVRADVKALSETDALENLNEYVKDKKVEFVAMDEQINQLSLALGGRTVQSAILVGEPGVGKTSVVYELCDRINKGTAPAWLKNKIIFKLDPSKLVAGTRFRGDFEEKFNNIIDTVKEYPDVILFVDEAHTLVNTGDSMDGGNTAGNILKPILTNNEIQMILATTTEEYEKTLMPQKAFIERFQKVNIKEPTKEETKVILEGLMPLEEKFFKRTAKDGLVDTVIQLADSYTIDQANPRKSINLLELAFTHSKVFSINSKVVTEYDLRDAIKLKYSILVNENKYAATQKEMEKQILGQDIAIKQICKNLKTVDAGFCDPERPKFSMLMVGPSGVGKTEACKLIAKNFYGSESNLININCGEFSMESDVTKLTGSAPGFVGHDDSTGLISQIRQKPNSIVLFDEVEKAHPDIMKVLLKILDDGEMNDNKGNRVSFRNAIIAFTTNLGHDASDTSSDSGIGFLKVSSKEKQSEKINTAIKDFFRPEFLGRLDDIVEFKRLDESVIGHLIDRYKDFFNKSAGTSIEFTQDDIAEIKKNSSIDTMGARGIKKQVRAQMTKKLIANSEVNYE